MGTKTVRGALTGSIVAAVFMFIAPSAWSASSGASHMPSLPRKVSLAAASSRGPTVSVTSTRVWTDSHVALHAGDSLTIAAAGLVHFGRAPIDEVGPSGFAWGSRCFDIANSGAQWPARKLRCWSLIARVGSGAPFQVGAMTAKRVQVDGELFLGVNDNYLRDNRGAWSVSVTVSRSRPPTAPNSVAAPTRPNALNAATPQTQHPAEQTPRVLLASLLAAIFIGGAIWKVNAARRPELALAPTLHVGQVKIGITQDHSIVRRGRDDVWRPFFVTPGDFEDPVPATPERFTWRGVQFRAVKSRIPFAAPHGEVLRLGQHVTASTGLVRGRDGYLRGRTPVSLHGVWAFTLGTVHTNRAQELPIVEGELTMFIRVDQPFESQAHSISASLPTLPDYLDVLIEARQATVAVPARLPATVQSS
jgi:hypothetical protein